MRCWDTRPQDRHLLLEFLGPESVRKMPDVGAEVGVLRVWEGRRAALVAGRVSSRPSSGLLAPARRTGPAPRGRCAPREALESSGKPTSRSGIFTAGPRNSWRRPERSAAEWRTRRVAGPRNAWHNNGSRRGTTSLSPRTASLVVSVAGGVFTGRDGEGKRDSDLAAQKEGAAFVKSRRRAAPQGQRRRERGRGFGVAIKPPDASAAVSRAQDRGRPACAQWSA